MPTVNESVHVMQCAISQDGLHVLPDGGGVIATNVATHAAREPGAAGLLLYVCQWHAEAAAAAGWSIVTAEPQSIELTVFGPLGSTTEHVLICGPGEATSNTETTPRSGDDGRG